ncbi:dbp [Leucania separata nucleopolyhedrovirus]|uniref:Dbp n=1 Tax=Leucania separata nucleopolyhedrovirus TaxID=1307956 RepID=Q0IL88_NPVLS|nr:dbp [Leucania separata nucleopolyhedrovirus]AAR28795.1 dbp [Leucania separata nucleopolyhedrovirus]
MPNVMEIMEEQQATDSSTAIVKAEQGGENNLQLATLGETAVQLYRTEPDDMNMRIFDKNSYENRPDWVKVFVHNLQRRNISVVRCTDKFNYLNECLQFVSQPNYLPFQHLAAEVEKMRSDPSYKTKLKFTPPVKLGTTTGLSFVDNYISHKYFFFDRVRMKRLKSTFGEFLSVTLTNGSIYHNVFGYMSKLYHKCNEGLLTPSSIVNLPIADTEREMFVRRFFWVPQERNPLLYAANDILDIVNVQPYTLDAFNQQFAFLAPHNRSNEAEMIMGGLIEGFKQSKNETKMQTMELEGTLYKEYTVAIKPMVFFNLS